MGLVDGLTYGLNQNKILNLGKVYSLKEQSLIEEIQRRCRQEIVTDYIHQNIDRIRNSEETSVHFNIASEFTKLLFGDTKLDSPDEDKIRIYIKETVCFVALQICDLFKKEIVVRNDMRNVSHFMKNLFITRQGTIDLNSTISRILKRKLLDRYQSCDVACYYFITEEIFNKHYSKVMKLNPKSPIINDSKYQLIIQCIKYWKIFMKFCRKDKLKTLLQDASEMERMKDTIILIERKRNTIVNLFKEAVKLNNEAAVHYLWKNYISKIEEKNNLLENALDSSIPKPSHTNISMFLLFHIDINEQKNILKSKYLLILMNIIRNCRWHYLFIKIVIRLEDFFCPNDFLILLNILTDTQFIDLSTEIDIAKDYTDHIRNKVTQNLLNVPFFIYYKPLIKPFVYAKMGLVTSLLSLINNVKLQEFLISNSGISLIIETIINGNLEFVCEFLLDYSIGGDDIAFIKRELYHQNWKIFYEHFMQIRQFQKLTSVIDWLSEPILPESRHHHKDPILSQQNGLYLKQMMFISNDDLDEDHFKLVDEFLLRCLGTNKSVSLFKEKIILCSNQALTGTPNLISCYVELKTWILESKWNLLGKFFNWKDFTLNEKRTFHQKLFNDDNFLSKVILEVRDHKPFLEPFSAFLKTQLTLDNSDMNYIRRNILNAVVGKYPDNANFLVDWYEKRLSREELLSFIENTGIVFEDGDILNWINPQDDMS